MVLNWPIFSLMFLIHVFLYAGVYCMQRVAALSGYPTKMGNAIGHTEIKEAVRVPYLAFNIKLSKSVPGLTSFWSKVKHLVDGRNFWATSSSFLITRPRAMPVALMTMKIYGYEELRYNSEPLTGNLKGLNSQNWLRSLTGTFNHRVWVKIQLQLVVVTGAVTVSSNNWKKWRNTKIKSSQKLITT